MSTADDDTYLSMLKAKLEPARIRSTLAFAGLYQMTHEMLKRSVIPQTKAFFGYVDVGEQGEWVGGVRAEGEYKRSVLALSPKSEFKGSLKWLANMGAISKEQAMLSSDAI